MARARKSVARAIVTVAIVVFGSAAAVSAVSVSIPSNAVIASTGQTTVVNLTASCGSTTQAAILESLSVSITFSSSIVTIPNTASVQRGTLTSGCNIGEVNLNVPGQLITNLTCLSAVQLPCAPGNPTLGTVLAITFQGVADGVSSLTFTPSQLIPGGCQINEGNPVCEPSNGQISVGPQGPTSTVTASVTATASATNTVPTATATATGTATNTATATETNTIGPSPTPSNTGTVTSTPSQTPTSPPTNTPTQSATPSLTFTASPTATVTATATASATATATPIPTPRITSGAVGGSTRVFGIGAANLAAPGIEIVAENGGQVIGTGGTNPSGSFTDGPAGIGLNRALIPGERIFPRDTVNGLTGPLVTVGPQPPQAIPTLDEYGMAVLGSLLALALVWRLGTAVRRRG